jgi:predicted transcriptional regulator
LRHEPADGLRLDEDQGDANTHHAFVALHVTKEIVCAYVSNNSVPVRDLSMMIMSVYNAVKNASARPSSKS